MDKARKELPTYQFLTAFPQVISRIGHPKKEVQALLRKIIALVIIDHPQQALWPIVGVMQSNRPDRKMACEMVVQRAKVCHGSTKSRPIAIASLMEAPQRPGGASYPRS